MIFTGQFDSFVWHWPLIQTGSTCRLLSTDTKKIVKMLYQLVFFSHIYKIYIWRCMNIDNWAFFTRISDDKNHSYSVAMKQLTFLTYSRRETRVIHSWKRSGRHENDREYVYWSGCKQILKFLIVVFVRQHHTSFHMNIYDAAMFSFRNIFNVSRFPLIYAINHKLFIWYFSRNWMVFVGSLCLEWDLSISVS